MKQETMNKCVEGMEIKKEKEYYKNRLTQYIWEYYEYMWLTVMIFIKKKIKSYEHAQEHDTEYYENCIKDHCNI